MKLAVCLFGIAVVGAAYAGEGTIMRASGDTASGENSRVVVITVKRPAFAALRKVPKAEVDGVQVTDLRESSDMVLEGTTAEGKPVVLIQAQD